MGTSSRLPGPKNAGWTGAKNRLSRWTPDASSRPDRLVPADRQRGEVIAARYQQALRDALSTDPEAFGIQAAAKQAGERLVELLDDLGRAQASPAANLRTQGDADEFVRRFVGHVAGDGQLIVDAAIRRAARRVAENLAVPGGPLSEANHPARLTGELFCALYQTFFGEMVGEFVHILIAENVKLAMPALIILDPTDVVADFVAEQVVRVLPSPCAEATRRGPESAPLADVARGLLATTVTAALGLAGSELELAA
ncbi:hypothetical protein LADH09A_005433 [Micromonospora sp. LAH09]|uniref:hypothetical protein n=1 Tax=Micromonospora cabrerizensis TaxID=2911213 RepID=UPI001EE865E5|nr:hypothetical protein [Micromonospora cabrerizensis]MCG5471440.1 hypothetical protein [Micromonospora cabrerizensis]